MKGDILKRRLGQWIDNSPVIITVQYPAARAAAPTGALPLARTNAPLVAPLTGTSAITGIVPTAPSASQPPVVLRCLWTDSIRIQSLRDRNRVQQMGWVEGAHAMIRVKVEDAALDPTDPYAGTVFDGAEYIEKDGKQYRVLQCEPIGVSFGLPYSYAVWVIGAVKQ